MLGVVEGSAILMVGKVGLGKSGPEPLTDRRPEAPELGNPLRANKVSYSQEDLRFAVAMVRSIQPAGQRDPRAPGIRKCRSQASM